MIVIYRREIPQAYKRLPHHEGRGAFDQKTKPDAMRQKGGREGIRADGEIGGGFRKRKVPARGGPPIQKGGGGSA